MQYLSVQIRESIEVWETDSEIAANDTFRIVRRWFCRRTKSKYEGTTMRVLMLLTADLIKVGRV